MTAAEIEGFDAFLKMLQAHGVVERARVEGVEVTFSARPAAPPDPKKMEELRQAMESSEVSPEELLMWSVGQGLSTQELQNLMRRTGG